MEKNIYGNTPCFLGAKNISADKTFDDIDAVVARLRAGGAEVIGEMRYGDTYRLAYIRGPEGIIVALAEQLG